MIVQSFSLLHVLLYTFAPVLVSSLPAQTPIVYERLVPYPHKPRLSFRPDGTFKITVVSDLHFGENPWEEWGPRQDRNSLKLMRNVLGDEKPDYVVINGDLVTGENTFKHNSTLLVDQIVAPLNELGVPFSSSHGNHDNQPNITHMALIIREQAVAPNSYTRTAPAGVGGEGGEGNYWVPVYKLAEDLTPSLILWFFDSRGGDSPGVNSHPVEDWVHPSVAKWIKEETGYMNEAWGGSEGRGSLAFVHMPPFLVRDLQANLNSTVSPGLNDDPMGEGSSQAEYKDQPFWEALTTHIPNLHALISGHCHGNEWCTREHEKNVIFCFGKHSGYGGYGKHEWGFGVRNLVFSDFKTVGSAVKTWIRMEDGEKKAETVLDETFDP